MQDNLLLNDVAKLLGIKGYRINYAIVNGMIPEPKLRISNKRIFTKQDVDRIAKYFNVEVNQDERTDR